jgi:hypothetical protein
LTAPEGVDDDVAQRRRSAKPFAKTMVQYRRPSLRRPARSSWPRLKDFKVKRT